MQHRSFLLFVALVLLLSCYNWTVLDAKVSSGEFHLQRNFYYFSKFGCNIGDCLWKFRIRLVDPWEAILGTGKVISPRQWESSLQKATASLVIRILLDDAWESPFINRRPTCKSMNSARSVRIISVPLDGKWSEWIEANISQSVRPHYWYFMVDDCGGVMHEHIANRVGGSENHIEPLKFQWEFEVHQPNGSHFSYELLGTLKVAIFHSMCYLLVLLFMAVRQLRGVKRSGALRRIVQMLNIAALTQLSSSLLHLVHLLRYSSDGHGIPTADDISETLAVVSQTVISSVMIFVAMGYTLSVPFATTSLQPTSAVVAFFITIFHIGLVCFDRLNTDSRFRFHTADSSIGVILIVFRLVLWSGFVIQCLNTINRPHTSHSVKGFLRQFIILGAFYFLAFPLIFVVTSLFPPYLQHKVMANGIFLVQLCSLVCLSLLFLTHGEHFKMSELGQTYLPVSYMPYRYYTLVSEVLSLLKLPDTSGSQTCLPSCLITGWILFNKGNQSI